MKRSLIIASYIILLVIFCGCQESTLVDELMSSIIDKLSNNSNACVSMTRVPTLEMNILLDKRTEAISKKFDWYKNFTKNNDYPYPYHENFGITKDEYNDLLNGKYVSLVENRKVKITFTKNSANIYDIKIFDSSPLEFSIDLNKNVVTTSHEELAFSKKVAAYSNSNKYSLLGAWEGFTYTFINSDMDKNDLSEFGINDDSNNIGYENIIPQLMSNEINAELISISIGQFVENKNILIYYRYINIENTSGETQYLLYYIN